MDEEKCSIQSCGSIAKTRGFCQKHYIRWATYKDPNYTLTPNRVDGSVLDRFLKKIEKKETGCWFWRGAKTLDGYGMFTFSAGNGWKWAGCAHRFSYLYFNGEVIGKNVIDHVCNVRICVNPEHLKQVSFKENVLRGVSPTALNARKTHCPKGHEYSGENLGLNKRRNGRYCKACRKKK